MKNLNTAKQTSDIHLLKKMIAVTIKRDAELSESDKIDLLAAVGSNPAYYENIFSDDGSFDELNGADNHDYTGGFKAFPDELRIRVFKKIAEECKDLNTLLALRAHIEKTAPRNAYNPEWMPEEYLLVLMALYGNPCFSVKSQPSSEQSKNDDKIEDEFFCRIAKTNTIPDVLQVILARRDCNDNTLIALASNEAFYARVEPNSTCSAKEKYSKRLNLLLAKKTNGDVLAEIAKTNTISDVLQAIFEEQNLDDKTLIALASNEAFYAYVNTSSVRVLETKYSVGLNLLLAKKTNRDELLAEIAKTNTIPGVLDAICQIPNVNREIVLTVESNSYFNCKRKKPEKVKAHEYGQETVSPLHDRQNSQLQIDDASLPSLITPSSPKGRDSQISHTSSLDQPQPSSPQPFGGSDDQPINDQSHSQELQALRSRLTYKLQQYTDSRENNLPSGAFDFFRKLGWNEKLTKDKTEEAGKLKETISSQKNGLSEIISSLINTINWNCEKQKGKIGEGDFGSCLMGCLKECVRQSDYKNQKTTTNDDIKDRKHLQQAENEVSVEEFQARISTSL